MQASYWTIHWHHLHILEMKLLCVANSREAGGL
jgi:hypothetical protein